MEDQKKDFNLQNSEKDLNEYLISQVEKDFSAVSLPADVMVVMKLLQGIRENDMPNLDRFEEPQLLEYQKLISGYKYLIGRHLSTMKGAQSYAFVFRKFATAREYNVTKDRLSQGAGKVTEAGIASEVEQKIVRHRRSEIAFQISCDRITLLLEWADEALMNLQNRLRIKNREAGKLYMEENSVRKPGAYPVNE